MSACMGGTRGSGVLSIVDDVHEMSVVRGVGGVCDMCMCLARGGVGGDGGNWVSGLGLGFTNPLEMNKGKVGYVSVFWLRLCGWCWGGSGWMAWARVWEGGVVLSLCLL